MARDATIRHNALGGTWETVGADRARGVRHEGLSAIADDWGPLSCRYALRRDPGAVFPDMTAFTPIEIEKRGAVVWAGRVKETPSQEGDDAQIGVEGEGLQFYLDDGLYQRAYVHSKLRDWKDSRTIPTVDLTGYRTSGKTDIGDGSIVIGWENGAVVAAGQFVGVTLDLGDSDAKRVVVKTERITATAALDFYVRGHDAENGMIPGPYEDAVAVNHNALTDGYRSGTFTTRRRYISIFLYSPGVFTTTADHLVRLSEIKVFRDTAYEAANASTFTSDIAVKDALTFAPLLDQSHRLIDTATLALPDFTLTEDRSPREVFEVAKTMQQSVLKVRVDGKVRFGSRPTVPLFRAGPWPGCKFKDSSKNSGEDIYNRTIITGTGPDGQKLKVTRDAPFNTLPDKRLFTKAKGQTIGPGINTTVANALGDAYLADHQRTPLKGELEVTGPALRTFVGDANVDPAHLLLHTTELVHLSDQIDPDTGAVGRDAPMVQVTWDEDDDRSLIAIDATRDNWEQLVARYAAVAG